jgi:hypothetical protein
VVGVIAFVLIRFTVAPAAVNELTNPVLEQAASSPSLAETTQWISDRVAEIRILVAIPPNDHLHMTYSVKFQNCAAFLEVFSKSRERSDQTTGTVYLQLLGAPRILQQTLPNGSAAVQLWTVQLPSHSVANPAWKMTTRWSDGSVTTAPKEIVGMFPFDTPEMADRVLRAFTHAIQLCGGARAEPF